MGWDFPLITLKTTYLFAMVLELLDRRGSILPVGGNKGIGLQWGWITTTTCMLWLANRSASSVSLSALAPAVWRWSLKPISQHSIATSPSKYYPPITRETQYS